MKEEAAKCLAQYGVRRTTVDDLVKRVNIPKGTFYLFYKSKELLLCEALQEQHEIVNRELYHALSDIANIEFSTEKLTDTIFEFYKTISLSGNGAESIMFRKRRRNVVAALFL